MPEPTGSLAIRCRNIGKSFRIGTQAVRRTFPQTLHHWATGNHPHRVLWALKGIDFELPRGEILGVIGPNGAGKSTLLLLLSKIMRPTEGELEVFGKMDPFFQLSAGLQTRLTVLDNFSLCAALLGIPRQKFRRKLPDMIAFSGLENYLFARYGELSTGMAARLPFAAAVHADLDIILVDEMLSVGDQAFQAKCVNIFNDFKTQGKTLVIASHNHGLIRSLCSRTLYLNEGRQIFIGDNESAIQSGHGVTSQVSAVPLATPVG